MLEFFPMEGEHQVGFVEVPIEFENWLIAVSGISFEDVSLNVLGEEDGEVELIMDYDDYMNLCDLYYEYDTLGWMVLDDPDYIEEINTIPDYEAEGELDDETIERFIARGYILSPNGDPTNPDHWRMPPEIRMPTGTATWRLKNAETFASTDWDEASWAEGFVDDLYAGDADENLYLDLYVNWASGPEAPQYVSDGLWDTVYEWWHSMSEGEKEAVIDDGIFVKYYNDALESYGDYEPDYDDSDYDEWGPDDGYEAEDFIEWNYTAEGSNCFICGRLWRAGDYEGHDNICVYCADKWEYDEGGPQGEGYYRHAETFEAPYAGLGALFKFGDNQSALGGFTAKELTESSAIHGDFDSASLNYSGKQNLEVRQSEASADDYGDLEYILLEVMTAAQVEEEYGDYMREHPQGPIDRDDLPWRLDDDYRSTEEAEYLRDKYLKEAETFDAHTRYNIHRFTSKNHPRQNISGTRRKIKQQLWKDTTASIGTTGIVGIIAALAAGVYYWNRK